MCLAYMLLSAYTYISTEKEVHSKQQAKIRTKQKGALGVCLI